MFQLNEIEIVAVVLLHVRIFLFFFIHLLFFNDYLGVIIIEKTVCLS